MSSFIDLTNIRFGKLLVVERSENRGGYRSHWVCRCDDCCNAQRLYMNEYPAKKRVAGTGSRT